MRRSIQLGTRNQDSHGKQAELKRQQIPYRIDVKEIDS